MTRIGFVGAGRVGSTAAYATLYSVDCDEIRLVDVDEDRAVGEAMDLETSAVAVGKDVSVEGGSDYSLLGGSSVIVISAGFARKPGMTRLDLAKANADVVLDVTRKVMWVSPDAVFVVVTNPVDLMTYTAYKVSGKPRSQVLGIGSLHDTVRLIGEIRRMGGRNVEAMMMGEHGDSMLPLKSRAKFEGIGSLDWIAVTESVKGRGMAIIERKGATTFTPASCAARMVKAILADERVEMPVVAVLEGEYGVRDIALGVPARIGKEGIVRVTEYDLTDEELAGLHRSADVLKNKIREFGIKFPSSARPRKTAR